MKFKFPLRGSCLFGFLLTHMPLVVFASEEVSAHASASGSTFSNSALYAISAGLAIGLAAFGGAIGQSKIGTAAMEGIARNPQAKKDMFVPFFLGLVLIESLVIYAFVIAMMLVAK